MPKPIPALAPLIPYSVPYIPSIYSVEGALDYLFYKPVNPSISVTPSLVEVGVVVTSVVLNWNVSRQPSNSISITDIPLVAVTQISDSVTLNSLNLTTDKTYSISVNDEGNVTSGSTTLNFRFKNYWGQTSNPNPSNNDVLNFVNSDFINTRNGTYSYSGLSNQYIYLAFPSSFGVPIFTVNGLIVTFELLTINNFTNASGGVTDYSVYKSINLLNGGVTVTVT
jgi:hypothetical protein